MKKRRKEEGRMTLRKTRTPLRMWGTKSWGGQARLWDYQCDNREDQMLTSGESCSRATPSTPSAARGMRLEPSNLHPVPSTHLSHIFTSADVLTNSEIGLIFVNSHIVVYDHI